MAPSPSSSQQPTGPFDLSKTPIHLGSEVGANDPAVPLPDFGFNGPAFEAYIAKHCKPGAPGRLIMVEATPTNWGAWECHTEGDEIVIVLEGKAIWTDGPKLRPRVMLPRYVSGTAVRRTPPSRSHDRRAHARLRPRRRRLQRGSAPRARTF